MKRLQQLDARIPSWDAERLLERRCPFCGDRGEARCVRPDGLTVRSCDTCGASFVSPAPSDTELGTFYATYSAEHSRKGKPNRRAILYARPWDDFRLVEIASHVSLRGKRVLDVGCGCGTLLKRLETLGAEVAGIDLDPQAVRFARDEIGVPTVILGTLVDVAPDDLFDVVCMFDFIEHPLDPLRQLERAVALLSPGGIVAIWTPNAPSTPNEEEPIAFELDFEHMQYLSVQTCRWLAQKLDLRILHAESAGYPNLSGIDTAHGPNGTRGILTSLRNAARGLPGWHTLRAIGNGIFPSRRPDPRRGTYHLFCILQRPE